MGKRGRPVGTVKSNENLFLDSSQIKKFFGAIKMAEDFKYKLIFGLIYSLGLRVSELCDLKMADVSIGKTFCAIKIDGKKNGRSRTYDNKELSAVLISALERWIWEGRGKTDNQFLFPAKNGSEKSLDPQSVKMQFKRYIAKAGLPNYFSVHNLRASCAVNLINEKDASAAEIMRWLRLKTIGNAQIYFDRIEYKETGQKVKNLCKGLF